MEKITHSRRASTPHMSSTASQLKEFPLFHSLRLEKCNRVITKKPQIPVILETETEFTEEHNEIPSLSNTSSSSLNKNHKILTRSISHSGNFIQKEKNDRHKMGNGHSLSIDIGSINNSVNKFDTEEFTNNFKKCNRSTSTTQSVTVIREQYWSCSKCCCKNWTKREKILMWIVACLIIVICSLFTVVGTLIEKNGNVTNSLTFYSWKL